MSEQFYYGIACGLILGLFIDALIHILKRR